MFTLRKEQVPFAIVKNGLSIFIKFEIKDMSVTNTGFNSIVETLYNLPLDQKMELKELLEHNISDARREEIALNFKKSKNEEKAGKLKFSSSINGLKKMI